MRSRASTNIEHEPITRKIDGLRPRKGGGHADAVHAARELAAKLSLLFMRLENVSAPVGLRRIRQNSFLETCEGAHLVIVDDQVPVEAEVAGAFLEQIIFGKRGERVATALELQEAERRGGAKNRLGWTPPDLQCVAHVDYR